MRIKYQKDIEIFLFIKKNFYSNIFLKSFIKNEFYAFIFIFYKKSVNIQYFIEFFLYTSNALDCVFPVFNEFFLFIIFFGVPLGAFFYIFVGLVFFCFSLKCLF